MIDKAYWNQIASEWKKKDDCIVVPPPPPVPVIIEEGGDIDNSEIDDILADLGLDDI